MNKVAFKYMRYKNSKTFIIIGLLFTFIIGFIVGSPNLLKVGNPMLAYAGIVKLTFSEDDVVEISRDPIRYITNEKNGNAPIYEILTKDGWEFRETMRFEDFYGMVFTKGEEQKAIKEIQFTRKYRVWEVN